MESWTITLHPLAAEPVYGNIELSSREKTMRWDIEASPQLLLATLTARKVNLRFKAFASWIERALIPCCRRMLDSRSKA